MDAWVWWLLAALALAVGEMVTTTLFVGPYAIGALAAMAVALAGGGGGLAVAAFLVVGTAAMVGVRPIARRHRSTPPQIRTGTAALVGRMATALEEVTGESGSIKLEGEVWSARAYDDDLVIPAGARVQVVQIRGAIALVSE